MSKDIERMKLENDIIKHVATLDTGSILVVVAFLDKSAGLSANRSGIGVAVCFLTVSLIGVVAYQLSILLELWRSERKETMGNRGLMLQSAFLCVALGFFVGGLITLSGFIVGNLM